MNESEYSNRRRVLADLLYDLKAARDALERKDNNFLLSRLTYCEVHMNYLIMWLERDWAVS